MAIQPDAKPTGNSSCTGCDCCDAAVCTAARQAPGMFGAKYTTCAAYVTDRRAPHLDGARVGPRCPCTTRRHLH